MLENKKSLNFFFSLSLWKIINHYVDKVIVEVTPSKGNSEYIVQFCRGMAILKLTSEGRKKFLILNILQMYFWHLKLILSIKIGVKFIMQIISSERRASHWQVVEVIENQNLLRRLKNELLPEFNDNVKHWNCSPVWSEFTEIF